MDTSPTPPPPINVEQELKQATKTHLLDQNDPVIQAKVAEFIRSTGVDAAAPGAGAKPEIPPSGHFDQNPLNVEMTEALIEQKDVTIDLHDKEVFLKSLLADEPVRLTISIFNGQFKVALRSRSVFEQERMWEILYHLQRTGLLDKDNVALGIQRFQEFSVALMVEKINDKTFSDLRFDGKQSVEEDAKRVMSLCEQSVFNMQQVRWTALMNAIRIFEAKVAKMSTEANNGDFWQPRG